MIKIIQPGIIKPRYTSTCPKCGCTFTYGDEDIDIDYDNFTDQMYKSVTCPTCQNCIFLYPKILRSDKTNEV